MMKFGDGIDWNAEARRAAKAGVPGPTPGDLIRHIAERLTPGARVADCGCNIARFYSEVKAAGLDYVGVDQADEALAIARTRYPGIHLFRSMLWDEWPKLVGPVAGAFCNAVLQHNTHEEKRRILARIAEAVPPRGIFAMQESTVVSTTETQLRQGQWVSLVESFGFKLEDLWHPNDEFGIFDGYVFRRVG